LVPAPAAGSLEAELLAQSADYAFVSLKHDAPGRALTTYAFEYTPITGPWSEVVDGFLFLKSVNPPHLYNAVAGAGAAPNPAEAVAGSTFGSLNMALRRARGAVRATDAAGPTVRGVVLDQKTKVPVPYASVPGLGVGTVADGEGRFVLAVPVGSVLQVSSVGYATVSARPTADASPLTVRLVPAATEL
jgi:hypothetical protein